MIALALTAALAMPAAAPPARVLVEATEFRFTLSRTKLPRGRAIVQLAIRGEDPHDLRLRSGRRTVRIPETAPGEVAEWRGRLTRGRWTLVCTLEGHRKAGMRTTLTVR